jgi:hypothetical protein
LVETAESKSKFCRDWRNRHIAHRDLDLAMNKSAKELETASISLVDEALASIAKMRRRSATLMERYIRVALAA